MESWPISDRPKLKSPGYIKMPGRPKTERKREPHEAPKATKMSRVGTIIRCHKCKQVGHNRSSCEKRSASAAASGAAPSTHAPSAPAPINPSSTQQSSNSNKRNLSLASSSQKSIETKSTTKKVDCNFRILFCKLINCYH
jgi:alpha-galactosidase